MGPHGLGRTTLLRDKNCTQSIVAYKPVSGLKTESWMTSVCSGCSSTPLRCRRLSVKLSSTPPPPSPPVHGTGRCSEPAENLPVQYHDVSCEFSFHLYSHGNINQSNRQTNETNNQSFKQLRQLVLFIQSWRLLANYAGKAGVVVVQVKTV